MALKGTFYGTTANVRITPSITWSAVQSVVGNYSDVTATLSYTKKNSNPVTGGRWSGSITIDGNKKSTSNQYIEVKEGVITQVLSHTVRVYHDSYGEKKLTISALGGITNPSSSSLQDTKISATVTLDTIPRASIISCADGVVGKAPGITIARADASFTHKVSYTFGKLSGVIAENLKEGSIRDWVIPESFYTELPGKSAKGQLVCYTYSGKDHIGTSTCDLVVSADEALCRPVVTAFVEDENPATLALTGDKNVLVRYKSTARCSITSEARKGATIRKTTVNGVEETVFANTGTGTFRIQAEDSRGFVGETVAEKALVPYVLLTARGAATRIDPEGSAQIRVEGSYFSGSFGKEENALTIRYCPAGSQEYTPVEGVVTETGYYAQLQLSGLDYTRDSSFMLEVSDKLTTVTLTVTAGKGIPVFDWGEGDFRFHVPVYLPAGQLSDYVVETGSESMENGTWYYQKWASGKAECWGNRNFGEIELSSPWGNIFLSPRLEQPLPSGLFSEIPTMNIRMVGSGNGGAWVMTDTVTGHSTESTGRFRLCRPTEFTIQDALMGFHCIGRWK